MEVWTLRVADGSRWSAVVDEDPLTVDVQGYGTFGLGQEVLVGGGYVLEHRAEDVEPGPFEVAGIIVPASCAAHDVFLAR